MPLRWVDVDVGGQAMECCLSYPEASGRFPAILVIQEIYGVDSHIQAVVEGLPRKEYVGLAPAMYHRQGRMTVGLRGELDLARERHKECTDIGIVADIKAAVEFLKAQTFVQADRIGIVGFCFGGRVAYLAACNLSDIKATVAFYGVNMLAPEGGIGPSPIEQTVNITSPVLGLAGERDHLSPPEQTEKLEAELKKHGKTYEFHAYPNVGHGFVVDGNSRYDPEAAKDAWQRTWTWFDKYLKG